MEQSNTYRRLFSDVRVILIEMLYILLQSLNVNEQNIYGHLS